MRVLALDAAGDPAAARRLLTWSQYLREPDGSYWTGCAHPEEIHFPADERTSYTAAAMLLASDALGALTPAGGLFRSEGIPLAVEPSLLQALAGCFGRAGAAQGRRLPTPVPSNSSNRPLSRAAQ